jgi:hypothetical protein
MFVLLMRHTAIALSLTVAASSCVRGRVAVPGPATASPTAAVDSAPRDRAPSVTSGRDVVRLMRERYDGKWFRSMTFLQKNTRYKSGGGEDYSQWKEYYAAPGKLRIDYLPLQSKSGVLYVDNHVHAFNNGKRISSQPQVHPLLLLGYDVYALPVETSLRQLDSLAIRLDVVREDEWEGRRVYVVGAAKGDSTSNQFWIDAERLVLRRLIQQRGRAPQVTLEDTRFGKYVDMQGYPVATEILFLRDGKPFFKEEYTEVALDVPIPHEVFDPARFVETQLPVR